MKKIIKIDKDFFKSQSNANELFDIIKDETGKLTASPIVRCLLGTRTDYVPIKSNDFGFEKNPVCKVGDIKNIEIFIDCLAKEDYFEFTRNKS